MKLISLVVALLATFSNSATSAEAWPNKPIRIIVTFAPGGASDVLARAISPPLSAALGVPVVVVNKPGANSIIATQEVSRTAPDGYTLGLFTSTHAINPHLTKSLPYDSKNDFIPLAMLALMPGLLSVNPTVPVNTLQELIALAKAKPGSLSYGTPGGVTAGQLSMQYLVKRAEVNIVEIPYKGGGPALADLLAGHIQVLINSPTSTIPHVQSGKLRPLATTGSSRPEALKDVPTIEESGFPNFALYEWYALFLPAGASKELVSRLHTEVMKVVANPEMVKRITDMGAQSSNDSPEQFAQFLVREDKVWGDLVKAIGIQPE